MAAETKDAGTLNKLLPFKQVLFWGSNNANELNLDPGASEGFVVSRCTCERVDWLKNDMLFVTPVSCLLLYKKT